MVQAPQRKALSGPTLVRLLARLADADVPESRQTLADRLSHWLGWTDAITLSSALNGSPPALAGGARAPGGDAERECARVRHELAQAVTRSRAAGASRRNGAMPAAPAAETADFADFRQRYLSLQQEMETAIGQLRGRLRVALAARTPGMARLATLDAIMERVLGARERSLLATVPALLGAHFERLRDAERQALGDAEESGNTAVTPGAWLDVFRKDMQSVLLAELEVRFQTVEGLLEALRAS
ncbi:DUF3348 domain-containing protein [Burkholderia stagnalis]|uniref:DUF3348 domain-containing protein n=1 Tax=Burkholderia stagnalis TaxID=1503054 RepID=A0A106P7U7_9BURK|nr:DUF3348 domain-containing protein [Burkholderia stagnalis]KVZ08733.1 hypothetical protein WT35_21035 [Burkholderia stagnalis]KWA56408.1 hypothetical protein WT42_10685 [Burkholderia stagnalis]KWA63238.1 hypothetical protein WT43_10220 [Burkholderia stagnalis]KWA63513.1 hypothetical protein WT44_12135 [Burkholderia stagnalis]KWD01971.1 hypothetical protein WT45_11210 [Burkholderia stagnalis]